MYTRRVCGRYSLTDPRRCIAEFSMLERQPALEARYNIAPSQGVWVVRVVGRGSERRLDLLRWGLARSSNAPGGLANVRVESLADKPSFATAFRSRRCLLLADGFYEWRRAGKRSFPHDFHRPGRAPFAMAGIWQPALSHGGTSPPAMAPLDACAIITKPARPPVDAVHDRMPAILAPEHHPAWLDPDFADIRALTGMLLADPDFVLETTAIGSRVNSPSNDDASCLAPATLADLAGEQFDLFSRAPSVRTE